MSASKRRKYRFVCSKLLRQHVQSRVDFDKILETAEQEALGGREIVNGLTGIKTKAPPDARWAELLFSYGFGRPQPSEDGDSENTSQSISELASAIVSTMIPKK
jgi:hypothetical protein